MSLIQPFECVAVDNEIKKKKEWKWSKEEEKEFMSTWMGLINVIMKIDEDSCGCVASIALARMICKYAHEKTLKT